MTQQPACLVDPLKLEFEAKIVTKKEAGKGLVDVILENTYFYPTGGGQPHDTGVLGNAPVVDVFWDEQGRVVHRIKGVLTGNRVQAKIDYQRRLGHMQHHSAQHILSRVLELAFSLPTLSVKISANSPSTVDVPDTELGWTELDHLERLANEVLFQNRAIKSYFITGNQVGSIPFRRPPAVTGPIRVVEVDSFDYSACGGTHCPYTGIIGLIKILKTERKNQKLRLHFVAGNQALTTFQTCHHTLTQICNRLSTGPKQVAGVVGLQMDELQAAQQEIKNLRDELVSAEAGKLAGQAEPVGPVRLVARCFDNRPASNLRKLGSLLREQANLVAVLGGRDGPKLSLVVSCGPGTGIDARKLLAGCLAPINGKGGGNSGLAQGGGQATAGQVDRLFDTLPAVVRQNLPGNTAPPPEK